MTALPANAYDGIHPIPFTPWDRFMSSWVWRQGEHVTVIGPTGTGKTTVIRAILPKRYEAGGAVNVLATKSLDANLTAWARYDGLTVVRDWPPKAPQWWRPPADHVEGTRRVPWQNRVMTWPAVRGLELDQVDAHMADVHRRAITDMFWQGQWCIVGEELWELSRIGLKAELSQVWTQGRSAGLTLVGATQRPVDIPLFAYSQASHLFLFRDNDEVNLNRLRGIGGMSGATLRDAVSSLEGFDVLYVGTRTQALVRTRVPVTRGKVGA